MGWLMQLEEPAIKRTCDTLSDDGIARNRLLGC